MLPSTNLFGLFVLFACSMLVCWFYMYIQFEIISKNYSHQHIFIINTPKEASSYCSANFGDGVSSNKIGVLDQGLGKEEKNK